MRSERSAMGALVYVVNGFVNSGIDSMDVCSIERRRLGLKTPSRRKPLILRARPVRGNPVASTTGVSSVYCAL